MLRDGVISLPRRNSGFRTALYLSAAMPLAMLMTDPAKAAPCDTNGNIICNGGFEESSPVPGSDAVSFSQWTSGDPSSVRAGIGSNGSGKSAEFLFSAAPFSQSVITALGGTYQIDFQYRSLGGQGFSAFFGDVKIFEYIGDSAPPTDWVSYRFNVQAFGSQSILRFIADSQGAAQNLDNVSVVSCPTCTANPPTNSGAVIDRNQSFYSTDDAPGQGTNLSGTRTLTFAGGTLRAAASDSLGQPGRPVTLALQVATAGGTIDAGSQGAVLAGTILNTAATGTPFQIIGSGPSTVSSSITNNGLLVIGSSGRTSLTGAIANGSGILAVRNGGQAAVTGTITGGSIVVDNGRLFLNGNASSAVTVNTQGVLRGTGRIGGPVTVSGILQPGNSPGTLTIAGPVTQSTGSTLNLEIDGTGIGNGAGNYSRIVTTGAYTIATGATLSPVLRGITYAAGETAGTNSFTPVLGQRLSGIVQADGGVTGRFSTITQPTVGLLPGTRFQALYNPLSIDLIVTAASYGGFAGLTRNQAAAGAALDALEVGGNTAAQPLLTSLIPLDARALPQILGAIAGQGNANLPLAAVDVSRGFDDTVAARQASLRNGLGEAGVAGWQAWGRGFGGWAETSADGNNPGFRHRQAGGMVGADYGINPEFRLGFDIGYASSKVTGRQEIGKADIDSYHVGGYVGWTGDAAFVDAQLGLSFNNYATDRRIAISGTTRTAVGKTDGTTIGGDITAGYRFKLGSIDVQPGVSLRYDRSDSDGFVESGADIANLTVDGDRHDELRAGLGISLARSLTLESGLVLRPELSVRWERELLDPDYSTRQSLAGQTFRVQAAEPGRSSALIGGGLTAVLTDRLQFVVHYDADVSSNRTSHAVTGQVSFVW
jgi:outer membrane autotransporter protein